ncbi:MAG: preprotein translocase subunit SecY, partial [SAR324 cluster bacterium]|nr:preprotein translocase subunit SecY [SAR324 cluster bacterium]
GSMLGLMDMFAGGALSAFSIFALGIMPYISSSIILQLLTVAIPHLEKLSKEGEMGRRKITQYTRYGTVALSMIQGFGIAYGLQHMASPSGAPIVLQPGFSFIIMTVITLTAGTAFIMWLGEQITERGLGNGISLIITAGILSSMPAVLVSSFELVRIHEISPLTLLFIFAFCFITLLGIVHVERSARRIPIQYPRRMVGKKMAQAQTQYLPLKVNMSGVIPPIFASALLSVPIIVLTAFSGNEIVQTVLDKFTVGGFWYEVTFVALIVFFCFFYVSVQFNPEDVAENLKKNGGFIPTVRPGKQTADFLYGVLNRITIWGAIYVSIICVVPQLVYQYSGATAFSRVFSGTSILIVVSVILDTAAQIEHMVIARNYEAFMSRSSKLRGGMGSMSHMRNRILKR